jgi:hypothetical protein
MKLFVKNVGSIDRLVRIVIGAALFYGALAVLSAPLSYLAGIVGIALLFTAAFGTCTLYTLLGISTGGSAPKKAKKK